MSNMDATRVMGAVVPGAGATVQMPAGGDAFRTQMGGTTTCPVCRSTTPLMDIYCGDCGYLLTSPPIDEAEVALPADEVPAAELVDEQTSRRYRLHFGVNTVGRQGTDILASEATVSRNHATITVNDGSIMVEDLGSSNGTKVADLRLQPNVSVAARPGDTVRFGTWKLLLTSNAGTAASTADRTMMAVSDDKTVVLGGASVEAQTADDEPGAFAIVEEAPAIALLKKLEGICDDIRIPEGMISLGRKTGNAIVLPDPYLSGRHVEVFAEPSGVYIVDVGSTNGTLVNGQKLQPNDRQLLLDGDEVQLGQTKYQFTTISEPAISNIVPVSGDENSVHVVSLGESGNEADDMHSEDAIESVEE